MKHGMLRLGKYLLIALVVVAVVLLAVYLTRLKTIGSIEQLSFYDDGYDLYRMDIQYAYDLDAIIRRGITDDQSMSDAIVREALPLLPVKIKMPSFGCSAFSLTGTDGAARMGRNYDFRYDTSAMLVSCAPKDGYRSIAFAALDNISANDPDASLVTKFATLTAPFVCLDGINEKGVSIAVLTLDSEPTHQQSGKETIFTTLAIRLVLDRAATTEEAVELLRGYDMYASSGRDYHFYISDASGDGRVVEYDCESETRELVATPIDTVTNFFAIYEERVQPDQKNGIYGHGKERFDAIRAVLAEQSGAYTNATAWAALRAAAQDPNPEDVTSNTQWSIVFNNTDRTAQISLRRHWEDVYLCDVVANTVVRTAPERPYAAYVTDADVFIDLPNLRQYGGYTCGTTCVQMVMNWLYPFEGDINLASLAEALGSTDEAGTTPESILSFFAAQNVNAAAHYDMTLSDLAAALDAGSPVMLAIQAWSTAVDGGYNLSDPTDKATYLIEGHYVLCVGYRRTDAGRIFYFNDPACVGYCYLAEAELDARWVDMDAQGKVYPHFGIVLSGKTAYDSTAAYHLD